MTGNKDSTLLAKILSIPLIRHSSFVLAGTLVAGGGNYIFNLIAARLLPEVEFGIFSSIISFLAIIAAIEMTLGYRIANLTAIYEEHKNNTAVYNLQKFVKKTIRPTTLGLTITIIIASPLLKNFLHLSSLLPILIVAGVIPITILSTLFRGFLQGMLKFGQHSISLLVEVIVKIATGTTLILIGLSANAPIIAIGVGAGAAYLTTTYFLSKNKHQSKQLKVEKANINTISWKTILHNSGTTFMSVVSLTLFYTIDIIAYTIFLVKQIRNL